MLRLAATWRRLGRNAFVVAVLLVSVAISFAAVSAWRTHLAAGDVVIESRSVELGAASNPFAAAHGTHLVAFVLTSSDCGWSSLPETMAAVGTIRERLLEKYQSVYAEVSVVGVATDDDLDAGLRFLADVSQSSLSTTFDQVVVGGSWLNESLVHLVWRSKLAGAGVPQIILVQRIIDTSAYLTASQIFLEDDQVVGNLVGTEDIVRWIREGVPLD